MPAYLAYSSGRHSYMYSTCDIGTQRAICDFNTALVGIIETRKTSLVREEKARAMKGYHTIKNTCVHARYVVTVFNELALAQNGHVALLRSVAHIRLNAQLNNPATTPTRTRSSPPKTTTKHSATHSAARSITHRAHTSRRYVVRATDVATSIIHIIGAQTTTALEHLFHHPRTKTFIPAN